MPKLSAEMTFHSCFWNSLDTTQTYTTSIITSPDPSTLLWVWAFKAFAPTDDGFALATVVPTDIEQATTASPVSPFDAAGSSNSSSSTDKSTVVQSPTQLSNPLTTPPVTGSSVSSTILSNLPSSTAVDSTVTLTASPTSMSDLQTASSPSGEVLQGVPNTVFYIGGGVVGLILFIVLLVALTSKKGDAGAQASIGRHRSPIYFNPRPPDNPDSMFSKKPFDGGRKKNRGETTLKKM